MMIGVSSSGSSPEINYAGGGAHDSRPVISYNSMVRFRPIAPKPATCPSGSSCKSSEILVFTSGGGERRKRKYVRVRRNSGYTRKKKPKSSQTQSSVECLAKPRNGNDGVSDEAEDEKRASTMLQLFPDRSADLSRPMKSDLAGETAASCDYVVQALVTVECVAATCTTVDKRDDQTVRMWVMILERDTCPGFVSDGSNSVTWVNGAFRKMVTSTEEKGTVVVRLVIKERFPSFYSTLTGHVKLQYCYYAGENTDGKMYSRVVPCDLWRIDGGGFAWRLDIDSALTLGLT